METNFNLGSLKTIQGPLLEYLNNSEENIVRNIELLKDEKKMPTNHDYVKVMEKLDKTFNMIGLYSLSVVFALCKDALEKVANVTYDTEKHLEILNSVLKIVGNTKVYIKLLSNGANDNPTKFFEDYQSLATLIRKEVSIKDLFNPRLELKSTIQANIRDELRRGIVINQSNKKNLLENLKVVENTFSSNLENFFKVLNNTAKFSSVEERDAYQLICKNIYEKFDVAQKLKISKSHYILFGLFKLYICVLSPVFNKELEENVSADKANIKADLVTIQQALFDLIAEIKDLGDGAKTGSLRVSDLVVKNVLFNLIAYVKKNPSLMDMSVYKELSMYFDLDSYSDQLLDTKMNVVDQININVAAVEKLFADLKEDFTLLDTKKKSNDATLTQHIQRIMGVNNKLAELVLPIKEVHILVSQISATLALVKNKKVDLTELIERELSIALVLLEYGINNIIKNNVEARYRTEFGQQSQVQIARIKAAEENNTQELSILPMPRLDSASQKADERKSFAKIFEQVSLDLVEMEETLDLLLRNDGENVEQVGKFLKPLGEMKGIFSVVGKEELSPVLSKIMEIWFDVQTKGQKGWVVTPEVKESIVLISGISLFVAAFKTENDIEAEEIYENIVKRFNSGLFKSTYSDEGSVVELIDFETVNNGAELVDNKNIAAIATVESTVEKKSFSLLDMPEINPVVKENLTKEQVVERFNNFNGNDINDFVALISNYLELNNASDVIVKSGKLLGEALASISIDKSSTKNIEVGTLKDFVAEDDLVKILKGKSKVSNETKKKIRSYMNSLPNTVENKLSSEGLDIHSKVEKAILEMLNIVAINNMPVFDIKLSNEEKTPEISLESIGQLKVFKEVPNDEELLEFFLEEVFEIMDLLTVSIQKIERNFDDKEAFTDVRRYFHTLKGSGRTIGLDFWGEAAWMTEQTLNKVISGDIPFTKEVMSAIKYMKTFFEVLVGKLKEENEINVDLVSVKMLWLPINNKMTHHVEVEVPTGVTSVAPTVDAKEKPVAEELVIAELPAMPDLGALNTNNDVIVEDKAEKLELTLDEPTFVPVLNVEPKLEHDEFVLENANSFELEKEITEDVAPESLVAEFEIADAAEIASMDVNPVSETEEKQDNIIIHGKEVPVYLFNMYQDESILHIAKLKEFVHANYSDEVEMDSNFMLHSHTLSSISKTVNLQKIASIANWLEDVAMIAVEREVKLSSEDMNVLRHAVDNLELFQDYNAEADASFLETLVAKLETLYSKLVGRENVDANAPIGLSDIKLVPAEDIAQELSPITQDVEKESFEKVVVSDELIKQEVQKVLDSVLANLVEKEVKKQLEEHVNKAIDEALSETTRKLVEEVSKNNSLLKEVQDLKNENGSLSERYAKEVADFKEKIDSMEKAVKASFKGYEETIKNLKSEVSNLANTLKQRGSSWWNKIFGK